MSVATSNARRFLLANILEVSTHSIDKHTDLLVNEPGLHYKEELVFDDGTVYKG